jgi:hypothetical protein
MTLIITLIDATLQKCFYLLLYVSHLKAKLVLSKVVISKVFITIVIVPIMNHLFML